MITSEQRVENWKALRGQKCRCGAAKAQGHPLCAACIAKLPAAMSAALFEHLQHTYDERYAEAVAYLETERPAVPGRAVELPPPFASTNMDIGFPSVPSVSSLLKGS